LEPLRERDGESERETKTVREKRERKRETKAVREKRERKRVKERERERGNMCVRVSQVCGDGVEV